MTVHPNVLAVDAILQAAGIDRTGAAAARSRADRRHGRRPARRRGRRDRQLARLRHRCRRAGARHDQRGAPRRHRQGRGCARRRRAQAGRRRDRATPPPASGSAASRRSGTRPRCARWSMPPSRQYPADLGGRRDRRTRSSRSPSPSWSRSPAAPPPTSPDRDGPPDVTIPPRIRHDRGMRAIDRTAGRHRVDDVRIVALSPGEFTVRADEAMRIYVRAMGYSAQTGVQRAMTARRHTSQRGLRLPGRRGLRRQARRIRLRLHHAARPVVARPGPARARRPTTSGWLIDAFELSEMHVLPGGAGRRHRPSAARGAGRRHRPPARCCSRRRTPTPGRFGSTAAWASPTWPATTCSPAIRGRSRCSARGCRSTPAPA